MGSGTTLVAAQALVGSSVAIYVLGVVAVLVGVAIAVALTLGATGVNSL